MPEGPEVRHIVDKLRVRLKDSKLLNLEILPTTKYTISLTQWCGEISDKFPLTCLDIVCRGKQIFFFFEKDISFYFTTNQDTLEKYKNGKNHAKFALHFEGSTLWYDDTMSQGNFTITNWQGSMNKMKEIGVDLLATTTPFNDIHPILQTALPTLFYEKATLKKFMTICKFITEQKYFSGIGNYLKSEILYRARIYPFTILGKLSDDDITLLFEVSLVTIADAHQNSGLTHGSFLDPDMQKGTFKVHIYKRKGEKDVNGYTIMFMPSKESPDGRGTYFVPEIQL